MFGQQDGDDQNQNTQQQNQGMMMRSDPIDSGMSSSMPANGMGMGNSQQADDNAPLPTEAEMSSLEEQPTQTSTPAPSGRDMAGAVPEELINIKQEALQSLKPLVSHLDQTPEEAFRMVMMMIQATDDQSMIPHAYEAAKAITDEKARAQALLDVVNEINYFTTQNTQN